MSDDLLVPDGARLLHIGPPKTGTTAIQEALRHSRPAMAAHGVTYPGDAQNHTLAARALLGSLIPLDHLPGDARAWERLMRQVSAARGQRVVISSEFFSNADDEHARRIVQALGPKRIHVVITLRPLAKILPSTWQTAVQAHFLTTPYEDWLVSVLGSPKDVGRQSEFSDPYWNRCRRHDVLVQRWAAVAGEQNVTVIVLDAADPRMLPRVFEQLTGLPSGLLQLEGQSNASLTFGEVELLRLLSRELERHGWSHGQQRKVLSALRGCLRNQRRPVLRDQRIDTPNWAAQQIEDIGRATADRIASSSVRVVGDVSTLGTRPEERVGQPRTPRHATVPTDVAEMVVTKVIDSLLPDKGQAGTASRIV